MEIAVSCAASFGGGQRRRFVCISISLLTNGRGRRSVNLRSHRCQIFDDGQIIRRQVARSPAKRRNLLQPCQSLNPDRSLAMTLLANQSTRLAWLSPTTLEPLITNNKREMVTINHLMWVGENLVKLIFKL